jgi:hypothetical protein
MNQSIEDASEFETWFEQWRVSTWRPLPSDERQECPKHWAINAKHHMSIAWKAARQSSQSEPVAEYVVRSKFGSTCMFISNEVKKGDKVYLAAPQQAIPAELQECVWLFKDKTWTTIEAMGKDNFGIKAYLSPISLSSKIQDMIKDGGYGEMANVALNDVISMLSASPTAPIESDK